MTVKMQNLCVASTPAHLAGTAVVLAGPLDPPAGPVAGTYTRPSPRSSPARLSRPRTRPETPTASSGSPRRAATTSRARSACRAESNNVAGKVYGIDVDAPGNIIITNTASGNSSLAFSIPGGSTYGPVVTGGTGQISDTNPWSDFAH